VRKVRAAFAEKGVPSEVVALDVFNPPPDFEAMSPLRRIPVLEFVDGSERAPLADSSAIVVYLEAAHPEPPLFPLDPYDRGRAAWIEEYADTVLAYQLGMGVMRPLLGARSGAPVDQAKLDEALGRRLPPLLAYLEGAAQLSGLVLVDRLDILDPYPNLGRLLDQARQRPAFALAVVEAMAALTPAP
jgi:glutathione S-transferase